MVATLPDVKFSLGRDIALIKAAVLYADSTLLYSPTYGLAPLLDLPSSSVIRQLGWLSLLSADPGFVIGEKLTRSQREARIRTAKDRSDAYLDKALRVAEIALSKKGPASEELEEFEKIRLFALKKSERARDVFSMDEQFVRRVREIQNAESLGLIKVEQINDLPSPYYNRATYHSKLAAALAPVDAYPALDERLLPSQRLLDGQMQKQRASYVATEMLRRIPTFESASFDELRDIKQELGNHLAKFRQGVIEISQIIRSEPWAAGFEHEVDLQLTARLAPEVAAIEDSVRSNTYLKHLLRNAPKYAGAVPAGSAIGAVLSTSLQSEEIVTKVAGAIVGAMPLLSTAHRDWKDAKDRIEENVFFFYYKASKSLERDYK